MQGLCPKLTIKLQKDAIFFRGKKLAAKNGNNVSGQVKLGIGEGGRARSVAFFMEENTVSHKHPPDTPTKGHTQYELIRKMGRDKIGIAVVQSF